MSRLRRSANLSETSSDPALWLQQAKYSERKTNSSGLKTSWLFWHRATLFSMKTKSPCNHGIPRRLDTIVARLTPQDPTDSVQLITGNEQNYKAQIEVKFGDKTVLLSAGSSQAGSFRLSVVTRVAACHRSSPCHVLHRHGLSSYAPSSEQHRVEFAAHYCEAEWILHQRHFRTGGSLSGNSWRNSALGIWQWSSVT